eukprot:scaffold94240_cov69-Phaeocystis_antarctica.AAC.6
MPREQWLIVPMATDMSPPLGGSFGHVGAVTAHRLDQLSHRQLPKRHLCGSLVEEGVGIDEAVDRVTQHDQAVGARERTRRSARVLPRGLCPLGDALSGLPPITKAGH